MDPDSVREVGRVAHGGSDDPDLLDFSANTNPRTPPGTREVYADALDASLSYPDDDYPEFRAAAAEFADCDPEAVVPTPGGLAALRLVFAASVAPGDSVLVPSPSFGEYAREIRLQGGEPEFVAHDQLLDADPRDHAAVVVCNPNNPTGDAYEPDALRNFATRCREADALLVADEAFLGFTDRESLAGTEGVIVGRSLTKLFGMPGLRAGFAVATGTFLERLQQARRPWNVGAVALRVGTYSMGKAGFIDETRDRVQRERERMVDALEDQYEVTPSDAPFILLEVTDEPVDDVVDRCEQRGLTIRDARTFPTLDSHVRVAVRRAAENRRLEEALLDV